MIASAVRATGFRPEVLEAAAPRRNGFPGGVLLEG